jgi:NitT/TauT family transport system substrate-binding protein
MRLGLIARIAAVFAVFVMAAPLASAQNIEKKNITIAVSGPPAQIYFLPVVLAKQLGYFEQAGLNVELQHFNSGPRALESVLGGSADIVAGAYENTIRMQAKGQAMQSIVLYGRYPQNVLGIAKAEAANYKSPADLKGKKIGITGPGSASHIFLNLVLATAGLQPSDVTPITVGAGAVAVAGMRRSGELYAISNLDLAITELEMSGDIVVKIDSRAAAGSKAIYGGDYASGSLYVPMAFAQKNPNTTQAVVNAMVRTLKWMTTAKPDDIIAKMPAELYQNNAAVYRQALLNNLSSFTPDGLIPPDAPQHVLGAMIKFDADIAKAKIDLPATYTNAFAEKALQTVK